MGLTAFSPVPLKWNRRHNAMTLVHGPCVHAPAVLESANAAGVDGLLVWCSACGLVVGPAKWYGRYLDRDVFAASGEPCFRATELSESEQMRHGAWWRVGLAIRTGRLTKPSTCSACGNPTQSERLHAHHADYSKPLEVEWLCWSCHNLRHQAA